jgi:hypothetical protein
MVEVVGRVQTIEEKITLRRIEVEYYEDELKNITLFQRLFCRDKIKKAANRAR